jgi:hypothetical protein
MDPYAGFHPLFILPCKRQPIGHGTSCPRHMLILHKCRQGGPGLTLQPALISEMVVQRHRSEMSRTSRMRGVLSAQESWS